MSLPKARIDSVLPLFEHSISDDSRQSLRNCTKAYCQQNGQFVETSTEPDTLRLIERKFSQVLVSFIRIYTQNEFYFEMNRIRRYDMISIIYRIRVALMQCSYGRAVETSSH